MFDRLVRLQTYDREIAADGARLRGERIRGTEEGTAGLDGIFALPYHGTDGSAAHIYLHDVSCDIS